MGARAGWAVLVHGLLARASSSATVAAGCDACGSKQAIWNHRCTPMHTDGTVPTASARLSGLGCKGRRLTSRPDSGPSVCIGGSNLLALPRGIAPPGSTAIRHVTTSRRSEPQFASDRGHHGTDRYNPRTPATAIGMPGPIINAVRDSEIMARLVSMWGPQARRPTPLSGHLLSDYFTSTARLAPNCSITY